MKTLQRSAVGLLFIFLAACHSGGGVGDDLPFGDFNKLAKSNPGALQVEKCESELPERVEVWSASPLFQYVEKDVDAIFSFDWKKMHQSDLVAMLIGKSAARGGGEAPATGIRIDSAVLYTIDMLSQIPADYFSDIVTGVKVVPRTDDPTRTRTLALLLAGLVGDGSDTFDRLSAVFARGVADGVMEDNPLRASRRVSLPLASDLSPMIGFYWSDPTVTNPDEIDYLLVPLEDEPSIKGMLAIVPHRLLEPFVRLYDKNQGASVMENRILWEPFSAGSIEDPNYHFRSAFRIKSPGLLPSSGSLGEKGESTDSGNPLSWLLARLVKDSLTVTVSVQPNLQLESDIRAHIDGEQAYSAQLGFKVTKELLDKVYAYIP